MIGWRACSISNAACDWLARVLHFSEAREFQATNQIFRLRKENVIYNQRNKTYFVIILGLILRYFLFLFIERAKSWTIS